MNSFVWVSDQQAVDLLFEVGRANAAVFLAFLCLVEETDVSVATASHKQFNAVIGDELYVTHRTLGSRHLANHSAVESSVDDNGVALLCDDIQMVLVDATPSDVTQQHVVLGDLGVGDHLSLSANVVVSDLAVACARSKYTSHAGVALCHSSVEDGHLDVKLIVREVPGLPHW